MSGLSRLLGAVLLAMSIASTAAAAPAPGGPGRDDGYLGSDKTGVVTATGTQSKVWATVQRAGGLGEVYWPDLATPASRSLRFVVKDTRTGRVDGGSADTKQVDPKSLTFAQTQTGDGWRLTTTYTTDSSRDAVLAAVRFSARQARRFEVYAIYEPALNDTRTDDTARSDRGDLVATDAQTGASALTAQPAFTKTTNNYRRPTADADVINNAYDSAGPGAVVQAGRLSFGRLGVATLALGFGADAPAAQQTAHAALRTPYLLTLARYAAGWRTYLNHLKNPPASLRTAQERQLYTTSVMVLAASEDKTHRGAYVASPTMPWRWAALVPSGPYHLVWSRDLYQIATGLIAAGDTAGAGRALDWLFGTQQKPDGSFPQNSKPDGTPVWTGLQMDEVAFPMILAHQLGRTDAGTWAHVKRAANFLINYRDPDTGNAAPWSPMERWENQAGYSPATIASEIAGLVCAAQIARANGDEASATKYLDTADAWQSKVKAWTLTRTGPYSTQPYFLRLTKDGNPDAGTTYSTGDGGPSAADQRTVVDPSFLDLVRLGVLPATDPDIVNTEQVVDQQLGFQTARGFFWHRAKFDGYGEFRDGSPWDFDQQPDSRTTIGRAWPLLNGERGEAQIAAGDPAGAASQLTAMTNAASPSGMLPEQVWDDNPPSGQPGFEPGTPTLSATPLAWTHAQYLRLAWDLQDGRVSETPDVVAQRYASTK